MLVRQQAGRPRLPRLRLRLAPRLPPELERVVREQGGSGASRRTSSCTPASTLSGPLLMPGTSFNRGRDRVFFFLGFEYFRQRLDTGCVRSWVPTDAMRNGDFSQAAASVCSGGVLNTVPERLPRRDRAARAWDQGGKALARTSSRCRTPTPATTGGFNYVDNLLVGPERLAGPRPRGREHLRQDEDVRPLQHAAGDPALRHRPLVAQWRAARSPIPPRSHGRQPVGLRARVGLTHVFDPTLTSETLFALHLHRLPERDRRTRARSRVRPLGYPYQGVFGQSNDQIPSVDAGFWGNDGPIYFNPAGSTPCCSRRSGSRASRRT